MFAYRLLLSLFAAITLVSALRKGGMALVCARLGLTRPEVAGPHVWWHGASNGELASSRPILERLIAARPDLRVLVTCNSDTAAALVDSWKLPRITALPAPLDLRGATRRTLRHWQVVAHVTLESELWPNRVLLCPGPVILLGARMRPGTAKGWGRLPRLAARVLDRVAFVSAQDRDSLDRLRALGLPDGAVGPVADLKALYDKNGTPDPDASLTRAFPRAKTWLAASTHEGEEETVLSAHRIARETQPDLRLILAPRHPARGDSVEALIREAGFTVARRSRGEAPRANVYLADTMGEMPLWYRLAGRVFIGGTLTDRGGHTPYEPAAYGCAILHGPDVANFDAPFSRLARAKAARRVEDDAGLAAALAALAAPEAQRTAGEKAALALRTETDAQGLGDRLLSLLPPPRDA